MEKTGPMLMVEAATGKDIRQVILDAVTRTGTVPAAAAELGLSASGLYKWIRTLDGDVAARAEVSFSGFSPRTPEPASPAA